MIKPSKLALTVCAVAAILALSACGDSTPDHANGSASASSASPGAAPTQIASATLAEKNAPPERGAFGPISADVFDRAARTNQDCNLDAVAEQAVGSKALPHNSDPLFSGWVADTATGAVPVTGQLVLKGPQDFALTFHTGSPRRPDVAKAMNKPAFVSAGFQIRGDLSNVSPGKYAVLLLSKVAGQSLLCETKQHVVVE